MNGLEIIVIGVIALCGFLGYRAGLIRVAYSLVAWVLALGFVIWSTPYITDYLETNTKIKASLQEKCQVYLEEAAEKQIDAQSTAQQEDQKQFLQAAGILVPENILEAFTDSAAQSVNEIFAETGIYEQIADAIAQFIVEGIAFFAALLIAGVIVRAIARMLDLVSYLPVIHGANKVLGAGAGVIKGLLIVWLAFYILMLFTASDLGAQLKTYIDESVMLSYLYHHNLLLQVIMYFI